MNWEKEVEINGFDGEFSRLALRMLMLILFRQHVLDYIMETPGTAGYHRAYYERNREKRRQQFERNIRKKYGMSVNERYRNYYHENQEHIKELKRKRDRKNGKDVGMSNGSIHPVIDHVREREWTSALIEDLRLVDAQFQRFFKARFKYCFDMPLTLLNGYISINLQQFELLLMERNQIRDDQSIEEAVIEHYGEDAAQMIRELI